MKIKKRGIKTQLVTLSVLLMTFLSSFSYVYAADPDTHYINFTGGQMIQEYYYDRYRTNQLAFNLNNYYTGTITLNFSYNATQVDQNLQYWNIYVDGAKIDSYTNSGSTGKIVFHVYNRNSFYVTMLYQNITSPDNDYKSRFKFTSASSSFTVVTDPVAENTADIDAKLADSNTTLSSILTKLTTANALYTDILGNTNDIEAYLAQLSDSNVNTLIEQYLGNIQLNLASMYTQQQTANATLSSIYSSIGSLDPNSSDVDILSAVNLISTNIDGLAQNVQNMYARVNEINSNVSSIKNTLSGMQQDLSSLLTLMNNIDDTLDNISWVNISTDHIGWATSYNGEFNTNYGVRPFQTSSSIVLNTKINGTLNGNIVRIRLPFASANNIKIFNYVNVEGVSTERGQILNFDYYVEYRSGYTYLYLYNIVGFPYQSSYFMYLKLTLNNSTYINSLYRYNTTSRIDIIDSNDIEYWNLINYFNSLKQYETVNNFDQSLYNRLGDIIDAINNIQVTVNVTEQQITNITNNFDVDIDVIHNVENNYKIDFDGWNNQLPVSDLALDLTPYNSTVNFMKTNITSLWSNPFVNLPIIVSCLCFVFMVILG